MELPVSTRMPNTMQGSINMVMQLVLLQTGILQ